MQFLYKINDMIPEIFDEIRRTYNFKYLRIDGLHSVFVKDNYAIALSVNRDYVDISFFIKEGATIINYWLNPFLMENLDDEDRSVCLELLWSSTFVTLRPNFCHRAYVAP